MAHFVLFSQKHETLVEWTRRKQITAQTRRKFCLCSKQKELLFETCAPHPRLRAVVSWRVQRGGEQRALKEEKGVYIPFVFLRQRTTVLIRVRSTYEQRTFQQDLKVLPLYSLADELLLCYLCNVKGEGGEYCLPKSRSADDIQTELNDFPFIRVKCPVTLFWPHALLFKSASTNTNINREK